MPRGRRRRAREEEPDEERRPKPAPPPKPPAPSPPTHPAPTEPFPAGPTVPAVPVGGQQAIATSDDPNRALRSGAKLLFRPGTHTKPINCRNLSRVVLEFQPGAVLRGPGSSAGDGSYGLTLKDCSDVSLIGFTARDWFNAVYGERNSGIAFHGGDVGPNRHSGILLVWLRNGLIERLSAHDSRDEHGIYIARGSDAVTIRKCRLFKNGYSGLQVNAVSPDRPMDPVKPWDPTPNRSYQILVEDTELTENGAKGAAALSLMGCIGGVFRRLNATGNQAGGVVFWNNGAAGYDSDNNRLEDCQFGGREYDVQVKVGSTGNSFVRCQARVFKLEESVLWDGQVKR